MENPINDNDDDGEVPNFSTILLIDENIPAESQQIYHNETCRTCLRNQNFNQLLPLFYRDGADDDHDISYDGCKEEINFGNISMITNNNNNNNNVNSNNIIINELRLMQFEIEQNDGLPQYICSECNCFIRKIYQFRKECERSQTILREHFTSFIKESTAAEYRIKKEDNLSAMISVNMINNDKYLENNTHKNDSTAIGTGSIFEFVDAKLEESMQQQQQPDHISTVNVKFNNDLNTSKTHNNTNVNVPAMLMINNSQLIMTASGDRNRYLCDICNKSFRFKSYIKNHFITIHSPMKLKCKYCFMDFTDKYYFNKHMKECNVVRGDDGGHDQQLRHKYKCSYCDKKFLRISHKEVHERVHTDDRPYLCNICGAGFKGLTVLKLHLDKHNNIKRFVCTICGNSYFHPNSLKVHLKLHTNIRPFKCDNCEKAYVNASMLKQHVDRRHPINNNSTKNIHNRDITGRKNQQNNDDPTSSAAAAAVAEAAAAAAAANTLRKRQVEKLDSTVKKVFNQMKVTSKKEKQPPQQHICPTCNKIFNKYSVMHNHIRFVHLKERPFKCDVCNKGFVRFAAKEIHKILHTEERPYQCELCTSGYRHKMNLVNHMREIHSNDNPFKCAECGKTFISAEEQQKHMQIHQEVVRFQCGFCDRDYKARRSLALHIRQSHQQQQQQQQHQ